MKKYKFIGNPEEWDCDIKVGAIYNSDYVPVGAKSNIEYFAKVLPEYFEQVDLDPKEAQERFQEDLHSLLYEIEEMLISKNIKYGNSALEPLRIFSKASSQEQLKVRIDDKLSRLKTQDVSEDEDVVNDLIGYLILYKISNKNGKEI
jgi:hypothetical protein